MTTVQTRILYSLGDACVLIGDLAAQLQLPRDQVGQAAALLIGRGLVERVERGCFQLTDAGRAVVARGEVIETGVTGPNRALRKPRRQSIRQRAWNAMKIQRTFTIQALTTAVSTAQDGDVEENLRRYCSELCKAGILSRSKRREPGTAPGSNGYAVFTLARPLGPLAPVYSRARQAIHDFNSGADLPCIPN